MKKKDIVFHLAALIAIPYSYVAPSSYIATNINGTLNILQAAKANNVSKIINTSTSEVYGTALYTPIDDKHPLQAQSPYTATKIGADKLSESFTLSFNSPVITVRPFNTFGPRQSARAIIPTIISQCFVNKNIKIGNLAPTRDFNYVSNTVDGFVWAASTSNTIGETINIGSGKEISIEDLVYLIKELVKSNSEIIIDKERLRPLKSEVNQLLADNTKAKNILGWEPKITLEEGLIKTINWMEKNFHRYRPDVYAT